MCADVRFECDCIPFPFCLFTTVSQCVCPCECTAAFILPLRTIRTKWTTYHTKAKSWQSLFFSFFLFFCIAKRLHNMIECAVYTSAHIHTNFVADGGRCHTCTHHTLTVSFLLSQTHFEPVQTDGARTDVHMHALSGDTTPTLVGKLDPRCPEAETDRQKKRSVDPVMCVLFTPQLPVFSLSLSNSLSHFPGLHLPFPQFKAANSALCQLCSQSCEITY